MCVRVCVCLAFLSTSQLSMITSKTMHNFPFCAALLLLIVSFHVLRFKVLFPTGCDSCVLQLGKPLTGAGFAAPTPSAANTASQDLSIFDAYAPPAAPATNQVLQGDLDLHSPPFTQSYSHLQHFPPKTFSSLL